LKDKDKHKTIKHTLEAKQKISAANSKRTLSNHTKEKIAFSKNKAVNLFNIETAQTFNFISIKNAAFFLKVSNTSIGRVLKNKKLLLKKWRVYGPDNTDSNLTLGRIILL
jgi:hypothetical protein